MLATKEYQTPNAIDPGEAPPSRPSRRVNAPPSVDDVRMNAARLLQAADGAPVSPPTSKFRPTFPYDAADRTDEISLGEEYNDDDEENNNASHSLPSVEEARLYAGRILSAKSTRDLSPESAERARLTPLSMEQGHSTKPGKGVPLIVPPHIQAARRRCRKRCMYAVLALGVLAIIIGLSVKVSQSNGSNSNSSSNSSNNTPASAPAVPEEPHHSSPSKSSPRLLKTQDFLTRYDISERHAVEAHGAAQNQAAIWIADHDVEELDIPDSPSNAIAYQRFIQRYVMALFYFQLNGPSWTNQLMFLDKLHECSWFQEDNLSDGEVIAVGVTCDFFGTDNFEVTELLLPRNRLAGTIPTELAHLTRLHFMDLNRNSLTGEIPNELERLSNMQFFDVRYNRLRGTIPSWIGQTWTRIAELALSHNYFDGTLPTSMSNLHELKSLALSNNKFTESLEPILRLNSLEFLYLENNTFTGQVNDSFLRDLENLIQVDISRNTLSSTDLPIHLFQHGKMQVLDLSDNNLMGTFPTDLVDNTALHYLALQDNIMTGSLPNTLDQLQNLHHLDVTGNDLTGTMPAGLSNMKKLTYLFLSENSFTPGPMPAFLSAMHQLRELSIADTQRSGTIPTEWIGGLDHLVLLDLSYNKMTGTLPPVLWDLPQISYLLLNRNNFTGTMPSGVFAKAPHLDLFLLDKNSVTGDINEACNLHQEVQHMIVDCEEVVCDCCLKCCSDYEPKCNDDLLYSNLDFSFENNYTRTSYAFSPQILFEQQ